MLAKLEKVEPATPKSGGETAKLVTLTKAIDAIQENSKSLETMGMYHYQKQIYRKNYYHSQEDENRILNSQRLGKIESGTKQQSWWRHRS